LIFPVFLSSLHPALLPAVIPFSFLAKLGSDPRVDQCEYYVDYQNDDRKQRRQDQDAALDDG
jgi:hypothetical protein